jgi:hypothetical protein
MSELATSEPVTVSQDTPSPSPNETRIAEKDMDALAEKVSEAATPKSEAERAEKEAADLHAKQVKAFRRAKEGREREETGKFAKPAADNEKDAAKALAPDSATKAEKPPEKADAPKDQKPVEGEKKAEASLEKPAAQASKPPQSWSPDKKAIWDGMSPEAREVVAQREQQAHTAISKLGQFAKGFEPVAKTLSEYRDTFEGKGLSYQDGIRQLLDAQRTLDRDPVAGIKALAQAYGVDLGQSLSGQRDPAINQLQAQVDKLTAELTEARAERQHRYQQETETKLTSIAKSIEEFKADKPDFDELEADIAVNIQRIREESPNLSNAEILTQAYERAQWANPKARQSLLERKEKEAEAKRIENARKAADEAKRMGGFNITSAVSSSGELDLEQIQRAAFRRAANR